MAYWRSLAAQAVAVCRGRPPGPVHLNLAFREPLVPEPGDELVSAPGGRPDGRPWTAAGPSVTHASEKTVAALADRMAAVERGLLVVGDTPIAVATAGERTARPTAGDTSAVGEALRVLAEAAGWPLLAEPLSGARTGDHAISTGHHLLAGERFAAAHRPDLAVRVGRIGLSRHVLAYLDASVPQVLIEPDGAWLDPTRVLAEVIAADPVAMCTAVAKRLPSRPATAWLDGWRNAERRARATIDRLLDDDDIPSEPRTARDLAAALPDGGVLVAASSMPVRDLDQFMAPRGGLRVLGNRGASGIDGFVSTALGVALAADGPTAALAGDLSVLHDQNGFLLADRPDLVIVVANNDGGGIFSLLPPAGHPHSFERLFATPHGVDFARLAALYGLAHTRVARASELVPAVRAARNAGGVALVEVVTDRAANAALHHRLTAAVGEELNH